MTFRPFAAAMIAATLPLATPLSAQNLGSLMGGALPGIGSAGVGNAAGLLGYCIKNRLTGGAAAQSVLGRLTGQPEVTQSSGYSQGLLGNVLGGAPATGDATQQPAFSLDSLKGQVKTRACNMVLKRAGSFL